MRKLLLIVALSACSGGGSSQGTTTLPVDPDPSLADGDSARPAPADKPAAKRPWPATRTDKIVETLHGKQVADPYRWLEDEKSPEVQAWMKQQDDYARAELAKLPGRDQLAARLKELLYIDALYAPEPKNGRLVYARKHADKEKKVVYWKQGDGGTEKVLLDPNAWSTDGTKGLGMWVVSDDARYVAYNVKLNNSDEQTLQVIDIATGKDLPDSIPGTKYGAPSWTPDSKGFYYTWVPPVSDKVTIADRPGFAELRYHKLGTDAAKDPVVYPATKNPQTFLRGEVSRDGRWLVASVEHGWNSTDVYFRDARNAKAAWTPLVKGVDATFSVEAWKDAFYVRTNDGAPRYRVFKVDPRKPARAAWKEIVPESEGTLEGSAIVGNRLVLTYLKNAANELEVRELDGKLVRKLELPPLGTVSEIRGEPGSDDAYLAFTSFTVPQIIFKTSIKSGKLDEWARVKLPFDATQLTTEQVFYPSKDGTKVSMFILAKKGTPRDGTAPTILYGYGGFNVSLSPNFVATRAAWLERGGVYAIPNLRGGGEYGEAWHRAGMLLNKQNVFDDYIAAAEYLIKERWTAPKHLSVWGGSNGGLLVGAAMAQRPELYRAVICGVPLLDMLRYHLYGSGKTWVPEYGSAEDPAQFNVLHAYSPYRAVVDAGPKAYPALLMDSADHDDRVDPMHARKFIAAMQAVQTAPAPVLLRIERNAGHSGADMVKQQVERTADQLAFLDALLK